MALDAKWLLAFGLLQQNQPLLEDAWSALNTTGQEMRNLAPALTRILALGHGAAPEELAVAEEAILPQAYEFRRVLQERVEPALGLVLASTEQVIPFLDAIIGDWTPPVPEEEQEPDVTAGGGE